jgi:CRP/FNR family cyclic AMP-dependent transcriptional regulator
VLRSVPLFAPLDDADWRALEPRFATLAVERGGAVFREDEPGDALYVVLDGKITIGRTSESGRESLLALLGPGEVFGELSVFDGFARTATAVAVTDATLARLAHADLQHYLTERPGVAVALLRVLAERLRATNLAMADLVFTDVPGRVAKALLALAERFGDGDTRVEHDLTQEELAQLVGSSRETVNKALADFAARGWIRLDARAVELLDRDRLARRAR